MSNVSNIPSFGHFTTFKNPNYVPSKYVTDLAKSDEDQYIANINSSELESNVATVIKHLKELEATNSAQFATHNTKVELEIVANKTELVERVLNESTNLSDIAEKMDALKEAVSQLETTVQALEKGLDLNTLSIALNQAQQLEVTLKN